MSNYKLSLGNLFVLFAFVLTFSVSAFAGTYGGGTGEPNDPYLIYDANHMQEVGANSGDWGEHFKLMADIDLGAYTGTQFNIIGNKTTKFTGVFDGNSHTISNFTCSAPRDYVGIFGYIDHVDAEVKNLEILDPNIIISLSYRHIGSLLGHLSNGTISNCHVRGGRIEGDNSYMYRGGLIGSNYFSGTIENCSAVGTVVIGDEAIGGLVGYSISGTISNCDANCIVLGRSKIGGLIGYADNAVVSGSSASGEVLGAYRSTGGLIGYVANCEVSDCYATGDITGGDYSGGLIGGVDHENLIENCYATGDVNAINHIRVGGLVGAFSSTTSRMYNCYATGNVLGGDLTGGLLGTSSGAVEDCYALGDVSGNGGVGGLIGGISYNGFPGTPVVSQCFSRGNVTGTESVGGLVGQNYDTIINSYSTGATTGTDKVGGLVGYFPSNSSTVSNCYATGSVTSTGVSSVGGLIGRNDYGGTVTDSFWDIETSDCNSSDGGTGKTTAEMMAEVTFTDAGWDFNTPIWTINEGVDYSRLWYEESLGPLDLLLDLTEGVLSLQLHPGIENSLLAKLDTALEKLEDDNEKNDASAINLLEAFINAVNAQRGKKIPEADADALIAAAQQIIDLLNDE